MLYFDMIDVSEGIYVNKTSYSKEYAICHYWCFKVTVLGFNEKSAIDVLIF